MPDIENQSAVPTGYMTPQDLLKLYLGASRERQQQRSQVPMLSPWQIAGSAMQTLGENQQLSSLMKGMQQGYASRPDFSDPFSSGQGAAMAPSTPPAPVTDNSDTSVPASIRNNNPGAMWSGPSSAKFGSTGSQEIAGGNKIATFDDPVKGAAAQFDLLDRNYTGKTLGQLIGKWSGGQDANEYTQHVSRVTGITPDTVVTRDMIRDPKVGVPLAQAMAYHEAGRPFPLNPQQWTQAHQMAFGGSPGQSGAIAPQTPGQTGNIPPQAAPSSGDPAARVEPAQFRPPSASMSSLPSMDQINRLRRSPLPADQAEGNRLYEERLKAAAPQSYTDEEGHRWEGNPYKGFSMVPGPSKAQLAGQTTLEQKLSEARAKPVAEAIERGSGTGNVIRAIDAMMNLSNSPAGQKITSGPLAEAALKGKELINNWFPGAFEDVAPAEAMNKINAQLASGSVHELTSRGTQFDFKTFLANNPSLNQTPEGRALTADILKQMAMQDREIYRRILKDNWPERNLPDIEDKVYKDMPIIPHLNGKAIFSTDALPGSSRSGGQSPGGPSSAASPPGGPSASAAPGRSDFQNSIINALLGKPGGDRPGSIAESVGAGDNPQAFMTPGQSATFAAANAGPAAIPALIAGARTFPRITAGAVGAGASALGGAAEQAGMPKWLTDLLHNLSLERTFRAGGH